MENVGRWMRRLVLGAALFGVVAFMAACAGKPQATPTSPPAGGQPPAGATATAAPAATPTTVPLKLLKISPERGPAGTSFTVGGEGLPAGKTLDVLWDTVGGSYRTELNNNRVEFFERVFVPKRVSLGRITVDAAGKASGTFSAPEDYGEIHDIYLAADGADVAKGGFRIIRSYEITPKEGPVGTLITVKVTGLGWKAFESTLGLLYDYKYNGFISATTTKGTAIAQIRAAGTPGEHTIDLIPGSHTLPYLNWDQSPVAFLGAYRTTFKVTPGGAMPAQTMVWPTVGRVPVVTEGTPRTTLFGKGAGSGVTASLSAPSGPIESKVALNAKGLPSEAPVKILWVTVSGNDLVGWRLSDEVIAEVQAAKDGTLNTDIQIPNDLGGWHGVWLKKGEDVVAEIPFYVERSLVGMTPIKVKAGEKFTAQIKGVGWSELDNGVAVTYDNAYIGYACGFSSRGDVTLNLVATGGPGIHLIDLYPMIYDGGHGKWPWQYNVPQLTALQDHPSLNIGYRLPIFRLAIEVVE